MSGQAPLPMRCETCAFWRKGHPIFAKDELIGSLGECHRNAPTAGFNRHGLALTIWPATQDDNFCGEWRVAS